MSRRFSFIFIFTAFICLAATESNAFEREKVTDNGLTADLFYTKGRTQQRPILVFGGSEGGAYFSSRKTHIRELTDMGYAILSLTYFNYRKIGKLPTELKRVPLEYFETAMNWLSQKHGIRGDRFAVYGRSRGGELALLIASYYPKIDAVIAAVPSAYVWGAYSKYNPILFGAAWTFKGKDIPHISISDLLFSFPSHRITDTPSKVEKYFIPVEKMTANVLLLSAKNDESWPSTEMANRIVKRLSRYHYPFYYEHIAYHSGHNISPVSWKDIRTFLKKYYSSESP